MKPVDFHPEAAEEAREAATRYERVRVDLGEDFRQELRAALGRIQANPQMYAEVAKTIRLAPMKRFPYLVHYEELDDRIWIAAIGHQSRRPGYPRFRRPD